MTAAAALAASLLVVGVSVVPFAPVQGIDSNGAHLSIATQSLEIDVLGINTVRDSFSAAAAPEPVAPPAPPMYTGGGSPAEWMAAAGIPESEWGYVDAIVSRESGWNPNATNSSSGACGLVQANPCEKLPNAYDPVVNLTWANGYANGRYGSWAGAYAFGRETHGRCRWRCLAHTVRAVPPGPKPPPPLISSDFALGGAEPSRDEMATGTCSRCRHQVR